jgi:histidine triad (HIT) family protein
MDCIFCKIINKEIPADTVYEDDTVLAFKDVNPLAPVHVLVIPKRHIESINAFKETDEQLAGHIVLVAEKIARDLQTAENGYKLLFRVGEWGGQEVNHVHLHLIGGAELYENIHVKN